MRSLPNWAVWSIVVPLVLLSPVIALASGASRGLGGLTIESRALIAASTISNRVDPRSRAV